MTSGQVIYLQNVIAVMQKNFL